MRASTKRRSRTVLVVDADRGAAESVVQALRRSGFTAEMVHTAADAVRRVGKRPPDVVVIDLNMPCTDGLEIARRLRQASAKPRLLGQSGEVRAWAHDVAQASGLDLVLWKPVAPELLVQLIGDLCVP